MPKGTGLDETRFQLILLLYVIQSTAMIGKRSDHSLVRVLSKAKMTLLSLDEKRAARCPPAEPQIEASKCQSSPLTKATPDRGTRKVPGHQGLAAEAAASRSPWRQGLGVKALVTSRQAVGVVAGRQAARASGSSRASRRPGRSPGPHCRAGRHWQGAVGPPGTWCRGLGHQMAAHRRCGGPAGLQKECNCSGRIVGQTSGLPVVRASGPDVDAVRSTEPEAPWTGRPEVCPTPEQLRWVHASAIFITGE